MSDICIRERQRRRRGFFGSLQRKKLMCKASLSTDLGISNLILYYFYETVFLTMKWPLSGGLLSRWPFDRWPFVGGLLSCGLMSGWLFVLEPLEQVCGPSNIALDRGLVLKGKEDWGGGRMSSSQPCCLSPNYFGFLKMLSTELGDIQEKMQCGSVCDDLR